MKLAWFVFQYELVGASMKSYYWLGKRICAPEIHNSVGCTLDGLMCLHGEPNSCLNFCDIILFYKYRMVLLTMSSNYGMPMTLAFKAFLQLRQSKRHNLGLIMRLILIKYNKFS